jgi:propionyl-CoA synthetase
MSVARSGCTHNRRVQSIDAYEAAYSHSLRDPESFWAEAAEAVHWQQKWTAIIDRSQAPFYRWYPGGLLNTCYCAVDRHASGWRAA